MSPQPDLPAAVTWARLRTFLAVHHAGSVQRAAEATHVTAPAVSGAIRALESTLGVRLFAKSGRGIVPTAAGDTFAEYARTLLGLLEESALSVRASEAGRLRIGAVATAGEYLLPKLLAGFHSAHPGVELSVEVSPRDELVHRARSHALDVVLAGRPPRDSGLVSRAQRQNELVLVGAPGLDFDPANTPILLQGTGSGTRETALSVLAQQDLNPPRLTVGTPGAAIASAKEGLGVALVHRMSVERDLDRGSLELQPLKGLPLQRPWHLWTAARPTPTARLFVAHVTDPQLVAEGAFQARRASSPASASGFSGKGQVRESH